ncbi:putative ribonuclease H-like domain-containing protein [Tanacetum coccineum]|uniref:Ribonuclease H-like domain-containing protein n=1 Tax=Tanacetum coccineum TaxID=301880 RepID=A0ABQ5F9Q4_9ASTR
MHAQAHSTNVSTCIEVLNESMKMTRRDGIILKLAVSIAEQLRKEGLEFTRECKGHKETKIAGKQESRQLRRTILVEETSCKAMVAIDWSLFDWSQVHECIIVDVLKRQDLDMDFVFNKSEFNLATYEIGLASIEEQLVFYKKNELEKLKQEKESNQLKIENFDNASKRLFSLPKFDLSNSGLEEFQQPEFEGYRPKTSKSVSEDISNEVRESPDAPLVEELVSDDKLEKKPVFYIVAKIEFVRPKQQEKPVRKSVKYAEVLTAISHQGKGWPKAVNTARPNSAVVNAVRANQGHPQKEDQGYVDSGCSRHMTRNMSYLSDFKEFDGGYVTFGGGAKGGKITGKGTLKTDFLGFFLASKDETSGILKRFITEIENLVDKKVKIIRCDNGTKFKNRVMSKFCEKKSIKKEFSVARTPQQNGVAKRRNRKTQIFKLRNRVLVVKPHNKTPYELFRGRMPTLSFMRPFGCHVTILNTLNYLGKFDGKSVEGFFVGYSMNSKAFRVYNIRTRKVEEKLHIRFLEDKPIIAGNGPKWLFDIDVLTKSMNYVPVVAGTNSNDLVDGSLFDSSSKNASNDEPQPSSDAGKKDDEGVNKESGIDDQERPKNSTQDVNTAGPRFEDPEFPDRVYKVEKELYGLHQAHRACSSILDDIIFGSTKKELCTKFKTLMHKKFQMSSMGDLTFFLGLQVTQKDDGIFFSQDKYVDEILKKFGFLTVKTASTPIETSKPLIKDENAEDVNVHLYRYNEFTPKVSHLHAVKRIFRYLKGQPKLGLWYYKDSPFDLEAYIDSDYPGASLDRKSTTGGCQFLRSRLISWQCKKQIVVANSTTEAEYMAATIKNLVFNSKTKHIEIRHHFIKDSNKKKLIQMIKIHKDQNVAELLTKAFDVVADFRYSNCKGLYERQQKRIQDFTPIDSGKEAQKPGKRLKRVAGSYATHKSPKKPKVMKSAKDVTKEKAAEYKKEKEELRLIVGKMEAKDMYVFKLTRADGSSSYHGDIQAFLRRLDRQDLNDLYRLVQERFQDHPLKGHNLLLWGDLRMIFDPDEKNELWMNQLDWKLLRWKLYESCGVHTLFMDGTSMEINMLVEKKYPLVKELLEKMMNLQLEAEEESTMAFELIKFIKSLLEE